MSDVTNIISSQLIILYYGFILVQIKNNQTRKINNIMTYAFQIAEMKCYDKRSVTYISFTQNIVATNVLLITYYSKGVVEC